LARQPLMGCSDYQAIPYTWGNASQRELIEIALAMDIIPDAFATLSVIQNCASALRALRWADKSRVVWIDAVCINQDDIDERSAQVSVMGHV
jgi:hypothetical protein